MEHTDKTSGILSPPLSHASEQRGAAPATSIDSRGVRRRRVQLQGYDPEGRDLPKPAARSVRLGELLQRLLERGGLTAAALPPLPEPLASLLQDPSTELSTTTTLRRPAVTHSRHDWVLGKPGTYEACGCGCVVGPQGDCPHACADC